MATKQITNRDPKYSSPHLEEELLIEVQDAETYRGRSIARLSTLWQNREFLFRIAVVGFVASALIVLLIPVQY
ncbi:MAG: hypothetical protein WCB05_10830, partial [Candidatus Sulfotelmatobacter sp.]